MDTGDVHGLTGAYAVDALDDVERAAFERHLQTCAECAEEVRGLLLTVGRLGDAVAATPPSGLRAAVLAEAARTPQLRPAADQASGVAGSSATGRRSGPRRWTAVAAAVVVLAAGGGLTGYALHERDTATAAQVEAARIAAVEADPQARRASVTTPAGSTVTVVVAGSRAVVATASMTALPADRTYQLWIVRGQVVTSAGLGPASREAAGSWARLVDGVRPGDTVAVSVEPLGGSRRPTTTPVAAVPV